MANRQEIVCTYIYENYVQFNRLRHDVISNKVQIRRPLPVDVLRTATGSPIEQSSSPAQGRGIKE